MDKLLEAILYVRGKDGITPRLLSTIDKNLTIPQARKHLQQFQKTWNFANHGLVVVDFNDCFKFTTRKEDFATIAKLVTIEKKTKLSEAAIETIAIIAYKQPITRRKINEIRGVNSDAVINTLLVKKLIDESGFDTTIGNPSLYKVTKQFYDYFNISSLKDLPEIANFDDQDQDNFELLTSQREK